MHKVADRLVFVLLLTWASTGAVGYVWLLCHGTVPDWLLPVALAVAVLVPRSVDFDRGLRAPRWGRIAGACVVLSVAAMLAHGAVATPSRHWDGAVAWDLKATFLAYEPTLEQPFFRDGAVFCHSRDYPLLQPLLVALVERWGLAGRVWFPLAYLVAAATVWLALRRRGVAGGRALAGALAFALVPNLVNPTSGAFDSGYADGPLCAWITIAAAGLVARDRGWIVLGVLLTVFTKPEGLPYAGALVAAVWLRGDQALLRPAVIGLCLGAAVWLPLQHDLHTVGRSSILLPVLIIVPLLGTVIVGSDSFLRARALDQRRWWLAAVAIPVLLLALPLLPVLLGDHEGSFGQYLADPGRALARLARFPAVLGGVLEFTLLRGTFGLTWALPLLAAWLAKRAGGRAAGESLGTFLLLLVPLWFAPFFLSPIDDLGHHLRSTLPRLLVHATGAAWLFTIVQWDAVCGSKAVRVPRP
jgi:hypothetical protein